MLKLKSCHHHLSYTDFISDFCNKEMSKTSKMTKLVKVKMKTFKSSKRLDSHTSYQKLELCPLSKK